LHAGGVSSATIVDGVGPVLDADPSAVATTQLVADHAVRSSVTPSSRFIRSRISNFWGLPVTVIGKLSTKRTWRGIL
jgi:hypothetical protein